MQLELDALRDALDDLEDPLAVVGTLPASPGLTLVLADGTRLSAYADDLVTRLLPFAEPAPFGDGKATRLDPSVRLAQRIRATEDLSIEGLEVRALLPEIAAALSPSERLTARLTDVHLYPEGGHFRRHKDTPREEAMVGTLVVWLPPPHRGGALVLSDGARRLSVEAAPDGLRWAAFAGDVDHEVERVEAGYRVTLAFTLTLAGVSRESEARTGAVVEAVAALLRDETFLPKGGVLSLACARHVIAKEGKTKLEPRSLRGADRELFDALEKAGHAVSVGAALALVAPRDRIATSAAPALADEFVRTRRLLSPHDARGWRDQVALDGAAGEDVTSLESLEDKVPSTELVIRSHTAATFVHEASYSATGYFGNEHYEAHFYAFATLDIAVGDLAARGVGPPPPPLRQVVHAKFGRGEVLSEDRTREEPVIEVRFADGAVKKLLQRFLRDP